MRRIRYWLRKLRQRGNHALQKRYSRALMSRFYRQESAFYGVWLDALSRDRVASHDFTWIDTIEIKP